MRDVSLSELLCCLPEYKDAWVVIHPDQSVKEIINEVLEAHKDFAPYYDNIALFFDCGDIEDTCRCIYDFLEKNIRYKEEKEEDQTSALPTGILIRRQGDCKHYAGFSAGILDGINRLTGKKIDFCYRFASYSVFNKTPHHVFVVVKDRDGSEIWIDPTPGANKQVPVWQIDKKVKSSSMPLRRNIAGIGVSVPITETIVDLSAQPIDAVYIDPGQLPINDTQLLSPLVVEQLDQQNYDNELTPDLENALQVLMNYGVVNSEGAISDTVLKQLSTTLPETEFDEVAKQRQILQIYIANAATQGDAAINGLFSSIWRGVKKISLAAPRNAYLSLVALNAFGYATKLYNSIYNDDGSYFQPNQDRLYKLWNKLGGDWHNLNNAIKSGHKHKAILGSTIGETGPYINTQPFYDESNKIGVAPAAIPAWLTVASAIIALIAPLIKEFLAAKAQAGRMNTGINPATGLPYGMNTPGSDGTTTGGGIMQWIQNNPIAAVAIGGGAYMLLSDGKALSAVTPTTNTRKKKNTALLLLGVGAAFILLKKPAAVSTDTGADTGTGSGTDTGGSIDTGGGGSIDPQSTLPPSLPADPYSYSDLDKGYYEQMYSILATAPAWNNIPYVGSFSDAVLQQYKYIVDGHPTDPNFSLGVPGAFMVVVNQWMSRLNSFARLAFMAQTLTPILDLYHQYVNQRNQI